MNLTTTPGRNELPWQPLRRLGDASLSGYRIPYPGMNKVVDIAKTWIENYRSEQFVRDKALQITGKIRKHPRSGHPDMRDFDAIAKAIHDFIVREIKYVRDQHDVERLQTPDATLLLKSGDCDDMVILGGALLESVGVPTRIKLIGQKSGQFSHIYLEYNANGQWKSFDPTLALYPGYVFPKKGIKAEKTVKINRRTDAESSQLADYSMSHSGSAFVSTNDMELGVDPVTIATAASTVITTGTKVAKLLKPMLSDPENDAMRAQRKAIREWLIAEGVESERISGENNQELQRYVRIISEIGPEAVRELNLTGNLSYEWEERARTKKSRKLMTYGGITLGLMLIGTLIYLQ